MKDTPAVIWAVAVLAILWSFVGGMAAYHYYAEQHCACYQEIKP